MTSWLYQKYANSQKYSFYLNTLGLFIYLFSLYLTVLSKVKAIRSSVINMINEVEGRRKKLY